jgi:hypothetical protein
VERVLGVVKTREFEPEIAGNNSACISFGLSLIRASGSPGIE